MRIAGSEVFSLRTLNEMANSPWIGAMLELPETADSVSVVLGDLVSSVDRRVSCLLETDAAFALRYVDG